MAMNAIQEHLNEEGARDLLWVEKCKTGIASLYVTDLHHLFVSSYSVSDPDSPAPKNHGYQRDPDESRFKQIGKYYLLEDNAYHIPSLIVSVRLSKDDDIENFTDLLQAGDFSGMKKRWGKAVMSIVDGQHRRGGLLWANNENSDFDPLVPVELIFGLTYTEEATLFDVINTTQRKLPKALLEVTKGDITESDKKTHAQIVREIAFGLAREKDSVWFDEVNMTGARDPDRAVTYEGLRRSTSNMFTKELVDRIVGREERPLEDYAKPYWASISNVCKTAWKGNLTRTEVDELTGAKHEVPVKFRLKDLVGVASLARLGRDIISSALDVYDATGTDPRTTIDNMVGRLSEVDWEKREDNPWMRSQAGFAGQADLYKMLYALVYSRKKPGEAA